MDHQGSYRPAAVFLYRAVATDEGEESREVESGVGVVIDCRVGMKGVEGRGAGGTEG
jgi:hypothetical protein